MIPKKGKFLVTPTSPSILTFNRKRIKLFQKITRWPKATLIYFSRWSSLGGEKSVLDFFLVLFLN
jgi:hypothetical protein